MNERKRFASIAAHKDIEENDSVDTTVPTTMLVCLHGCPYSSLSWAPFVKELRTKRKMTKFEIYAIDLRNHGESIIEQPRRTTLV